MVLLVAASLVSLVNSYTAQDMVTHLAARGHHRAAATEIAGDVSVARMQVWRALATGDERILERGRQAAERRRDRARMARQGHHRGRPQSQSAVDRAEARRLPEACRRASRSSYPGRSARRRRGTRTARQGGLRGRHDRRRAQRAIAPIFRRRRPDGIRGRRRVRARLEDHARDQQRRRCARRGALHGHHRQHPPADPRHHGDHRRARPRRLLGRRPPYRGAERNRRNGAFGRGIESQRRRARAAAGRTRRCPRGRASANASEPPPNAPAAPRNRPRPCRASARDCASSPAAI